MTKQIFYVGSSVKSKAQWLDPSTRSALSVFSFDDGSGVISPAESVFGIDHVGWIALDKAKLQLYAASEVFHWEEGTISAYSIDANTGKLTYVNKQASRGNTTCHLELSHDGRYLAATNYAFGETPGPDASIVLFARGAELSTSVSEARHDSWRQDPKQGRSHAHCCWFSPDSTLLFVTDAGIDQMLAYRVTHNTITHDPELDIRFPKGSEPRLAVVHPDGEHAFILHEGKPGLSVIHFTNERAIEISSLSIPYGHRVSPCAVEISPDGRHVYATMREIGEVIGFAVQPDFGVREIGRWKTAGLTPWAARMSPSGRYLLVGNNDKANIEVFGRDLETGHLTATSMAVDCPDPMCIKFL